MDFGEQRLLRLASEMVDNHNLIGALKLLNKNAQQNGNSENSLMLYAEIFDDMQLYEKCVNYWFRFLDAHKNLDIADAYEGLAVAFMNMGNEHFAAFYYNKLLQETDDLPKEAREDIIKAFMRKEESPLKIVYPPKYADYSKQLAEGVDYMRINDFDSAIKTFEEVQEGNEKYLVARNYIAMCKIISDKCEEAERECLNILKVDPDNIQALTTLAAVKTEQKNGEEGKILAERLVNIKAENIDDIYKIATVCCENKMHGKAYELFCKLESELGYDCTVLYFKAISAYNSGNLKGSLEAFEKLLTIYPNAVTAKFYYQYIKGEPEEKELSYFYRLPAKERESSLKFLSAFVKLTPKTANSITDIMDITECIRWCFDEGDLKEDSELYHLAASCAVQAKADDLVREILLNAFYSDALKIRALSLLAERNEQNEFGVVICNMYKRLQTHKLNLGRAKRKYFITSYANLFSRFCIIEERYGVKFKNICQKLYRKMEEANALDICKDVNSLTAAIFSLANIAEVGIDKKAAHKFFDADKATVDLILSYAN